MARKDHSYNSGRIHRASGNASDRPEQRGRQSMEGQASRTAQPSHARQGQAQKSRIQGGGHPQKVTYSGGRHSGARGGVGVRARRKPLWPKIVIPVVGVLVVAGIILGMLYNKVDNAFAIKDYTGTIKEEDNLDRLYDKSDVLNFLLLGIDYEEGRDFKNTDMVMYINFDVKNSQLNMLQIPRDSYVGMESTPNGKINAVMASGPDTENPINNIVDVIENQFKLPVDYYLSLDMDGMRDMVDALGGIEVYVPKELSFDGSYLPPGLQLLDGAAAEFFVRVRIGEGFERSDIDRLENQRYFYAAFFRRLMNVGASDMLNLLPIFEKYVSTDFSESDILALINSLKATGSEGMLFARVPGATEVKGVWATDPPEVMYIDLYGRRDPNFSEEALQASVDAGEITQEEMDEQVAAYEDYPGVANLLNEHFRAHSSAVPAEELGLPQVVIPDNIALYPSGIQRMSEVSNTSPEG